MIAKYQLELLSLSDETQTYKGDCVAGIVRRLLDAETKLSRVLDEHALLSEELSEERKAHDEIASICFAVGVETGDGTSIEAVKRLAAALSKLREENRWIPVSEKPPKFRDRVFIRMKNKFTIIATFYIDDWTMDSGIRVGLDEVTHWHPLPKGPEVEP